MSPAAAFRAYKGLFKTRRVALREVSTDTDWAGIFIPGTRSDTILINTHLCPDIVGTVLHELIHAEQAKLGVPTDHGSYFQARVAELREKHNLEVYT
jgi:hypothetical protein